MSESLASNGRLCKGVKVLSFGKRSREGEKSILVFAQWAIDGAVAAT